MHIYHILLSVGSVSSFIVSPSLKLMPSRSRITILHETIVSPFQDGEESTDPAPYTLQETEGDKEPLDLTWENVDLVLEEMRPYLQADGGDVTISEIDGPVVRLELQVSAIQ